MNKVRRKSKRQKTGSRLFSKNRSWYNEPELIELSACGCGMMLHHNTKILHRGMKYQQQAPAFKRKKSTQLKAWVFKQVPHKLREPGRKDEAQLVPDLRRESVFNFDGKASKGQRLKQQEERKEVFYRLQTNAKEKKLVKGGACGILLLAPNLHGNKMASHSGEEPRN